MKTQIIINRSTFAMERIIDESPDTSWLGEYSNHWKENAIDRQKRGDMGRHQYRYFVPANPKYAEQDYLRMESLNRGDWTFIGVRASVVLEIPSKQGGWWTRQTIHSPGLWGIESDSGADYLEQVFHEECDVLAEMLEMLNVTIAA